MWLRWWLWVVGGKLHPERLQHRRVRSGARPGQRPPASGTPDSGQFSRLSPPASCSRIAPSLLIRPSFLEVLSFPRPVSAASVQTGRSARPDTRPLLWSVSWSLLPQKKRVCVRACVSVFLCVCTCAYVCVYTESPERRPLPSSHRLVLRHRRVCRPFRSQVPALSSFSVLSLKLLLSPLCPRKRLQLSRGPSRPPRHLRRG